MDDMDVIGPFSSWANLKTGYGAVGDGLTDDTAALQSALNDLGQPGKPSALYLPPGTYRITSSLQLKGSKSGSYVDAWGGLSIVGEDPMQTTILWDGPSGDPMLIQDGGFNYRYSRITWDGNQKAGYGIAHWWNTSEGTMLDGSSEDVDEVFKDMGIGIMGGRMGQNYGQLNSEGQVRRVTFLRNWVAGVDVGEWNAVNWWVWDSHFVDCARGVSNTFTLLDSGSGVGAGGFHVYRNLFERSTISDVNVANTQWFSLHNNTSSGSRRFFQAEGAGANPSAVIMENNTVINPSDPVAVDVGNLGPLMMIDNVFMRPTTSTGPTVSMSDWTNGRDVLSFGNSYTALPAIQNGNRVRIYADQQVSFSGVNPTLPTLPPTPSRTQHPVFEIPNNASAETIQAIINQASASPSSIAPIIHFPPGWFRINQTLLVPSSTPIQITGDGLTTTIEWTGADGASIFKLAGPSKATVRDMHFIHHPQTAYAIEITQADQAGGRILFEGSLNGKIDAASLTQTFISAQANTGFNGLVLQDVASFVSIGANIGPVVSNNSNVLLSDTWYEGNNSTNLYQISSGNFSYLGGVIAPASSLSTEPAMLLDNFKGQLTWLGASFEIGGLASGIGIQVGTETTDTNALFLGEFFRIPGAFHRSTAVGTIGLVESKSIGSQGGVVSVLDQGVRSNSFIYRSLQQARSAIWETQPYQAPVDATDVRIYRIKSNQTAGIHISGQ